MRNKIITLAICYGAIVAALSGYSLVNNITGGETVIPMTTAMETTVVNMFIDPFDPFSKGIIFTKPAEEPSTTEQSLEEKQAIETSTKTTEAKTEKHTEHVVEVYSEEHIEEAHTEEEYSEEEYEEEYEEPVVYEDNEEDNGYIGTMKITGYTAEEGFYKGSATASGVPVGEGMCALNNAQRKSLGISYGDSIYISGLGTYTVVDCGCSWGVVDVWVWTNAEAYAMTGYYEVYYA